MSFARGFEAGFGLVDRHYAGKAEERQRAEDLARRERERLDEAAYRKQMIESRNAELADQRAYRETQASLERDRLGIMRTEADAMARWREEQAAAAREERQLAAKQRAEYEQAQAAERVWTGMLRGYQIDDNDLETVKGTRFDPRRFQDPKLEQDVNLIQQYMEGTPVDPSQLSDSASRLLRPMINQGVGEPAVGQYAGRYQGWTVESKTLDSIIPVNSAQGEFGSGKGFVQANVLVKVRNPKTGEVGYYEAPVTVGREMGGSPNQIPVERLVDYWAGNKLMVEAIKMNPESQRFYEMNIARMNQKEMASLQKAAEGEWSQKRRELLDNNAYAIQAGYEMYEQDYNKVKEEAELNGEEAPQKKSYAQFKEEYVIQSLGTRTDYVNEQFAAYQGMSQYSQPEDSVSSDKLMRKYQFLGVRDKQEALDVQSIKESYPDAWGAFAAFWELTGRHPSIEEMRTYAPEIQRASQAGDEETLAKIREDMLSLPQNKPMKRSQLPMESGNGL